MSLVIRTFAQVHSRIVVPTVDPSKPPGPTRGPFDYSDFQPDPGAVPKGGVLTRLSEGMLWIGFTMAIAALAAGAIMWMIGPVFGSHHVAAQGKTFMWKALGGIAILGAAGAICGFVVSAVA